ncbi:MAG: hypothetical protein NTY93_00685 [Candidatus Kaiserbacteria bacterium]|nr:hypothetical protein [Candidatus Kaiserbacteria bacterium]
MQNFKKLFRYGGGEGDGDNNYGTVTDSGGSSSTGGSGSSDAGGSETSSSGSN